MKKFAAFDIDGTLIRWQLYHSIVDKLAKNGALGPDAHEQIHQARMKWKRREGPEGFKAYEAALIQLYEQAITSLDPTVFDVQVSEVVNEFKDQVYTYTRDLIKKLKEQGYFLIAISGSQKELVAQIAEYYGFDDYIGTEYHRDNKAFSGEVFVASQNKKVLLESLIKEHDLTTTGSYAVGDSKSDAPMLEIVENPIAFNPDQQLYQIAAAHNWKVVLERKNMVYELESQNGQYILAQTEH